MEEKKFNREKFIKQLEQKGVNKNCNRCGHNSFALLDGYTFLPVNKEVGNILGGPSIPAILVVCNNCGAITPHALGAFEKIEEDGK